METTIRYRIILK